MVNMYKEAWRESKARTSDPSGFAEDGWEPILIKAFKPKSADGSGSKGYLYLVRFKRIPTKELYSREVEGLIRGRYSVSDELALLRQKDVKPDEYLEYCRYAEDCKAKAREHLGYEDK